MANNLKKKLSLAGIRKYFDNKTGLLSKTNLDEKVGNFVSRGVKNVKQSFKEDPGQYSITRAFSGIQPAAQTVFEPMFGKQTASDIGFGLRGATQLHPFQWANMVTPGSKAGQQYYSTTPITARQKTAQSIGRSGYGLALTAPIGGGNAVKNVLTRGLTSTVGGAGIGAGMSAITGGDIAEGAKKGALSGFSAAPLLAITNPLTEKAVAAIGGGFGVQQTLGRGVGGIANIIEDEILAKVDGIDVTNKDRVTSFLIGAAMTNNKMAWDKAKSELKSIGIKNADDVVKKAKTRLEYDIKYQPMENGKYYPVAVLKSESSFKDANGKVVWLVNEKDVPTGDKISVTNKSVLIKQAKQRGFFRIGQEPKIKTDESLLKNRLKNFESMSAKTDAQLKVEYKDKFNQFGKKEFGKKFDSKVWNEIFENAWKRSNTPEEFIKNFELSSKQFAGTEQSATKLLKQMFPDKVPVSTTKISGEEIPPMPTDLDYQPEFIPKKAPITAENIVNKKSSSLFLKDEEFSSLPTKQDQIEYIVRVQHKIKNFIDKFSSKMPDQEDFVKSLRENTEKYPKLKQTHEAIVNKFATLIKETDPNFNPKSNYYPEMDLANQPRTILEEIENGLWVSRLDSDLGAFMPNKDILKGSSEYNTVMKSYVDQALTKKYINNLKPDNTYQEAIINYSKEVKQAINNKDIKVKDIVTPDFVGKGNEINEVLKVVDYKISGFGTEARTNDSVFRKIGGDINNAWRKLRDADVGINGWRDAKEAKNKALDNFLNVVGQHRFEDGRTKQYVNDTIAELTTVKALENNFLTSATNVITNTFSRAHLGLSVKTGVMQVLETTKIPFLYKPKDIIKGITKLVNPNEVKRIVESYNLKELNNAYDVKALRTKLTKKGIIATFDKILFAPLAKGEELKNVVYSSIAEEAGKSKGYSGKKLTSYVRDHLFKYGNVSSSYNKANVFKRNLGRLLLQYSQYGFKNTQLIKDLADDKEYKKAVGVMASNIINMGIIMGVTGLPLKYAYQQLLPAGLGPVTSFPTDILEQINKEQSPENKKARIGKKLVQNLVPGGTQAIRTIEALKASKGYDVTPTGRVQYYGDEANLAQKVKSSVFGRSSLPMVKSYWKEKRGLLGENQSKAFLAKQDDNQKQYAEQIFKTRELSDQKKDLLKDNTQEEGFFQRLFNKEETKQTQEFETQADYDLVESRISLRDETLTSNELTKYYMRDLENKPTSKYEQVKREKDIYSRLGVIDRSEKLTDQQKDETINNLIKEVGITRKSYDYYQVANESVDARTAYVQDKVESGELSNRQDLIKFLVEMREEVNGKVVATSPVLKDLYDQGLITKDEYTKLKNFKYASGSDGSKTPKVKLTGRGSGAKLKSISIADFLPSSLPKGTKIKAASIPKISKAKTTSFSKQPLIKTDLLKTQDYTGKPAQAIARIKNIRKYNL